MIACDFPLQKDRRWHAGYARAGRAV